METPLLLTWEEAGRWPRVSACLGGKARSLVTLREAGLPVPDGAVLTTRALDEHLSASSLAKEVERLWSEATRTGVVDAARCEAVRAAIEASPLPHAVEDCLAAYLAPRAQWRLAVRSSGTQEDTGTDSFAGLYETVLDVQGQAAVASALRRCWASLFGERVLAYCLRRKVDVRGMGLAVILQRLVDAEKSGVLFTVDPVSGRDKEMVIEAVFGLGEALVSGRLTPDRYTWDWYSRRETAREVSQPHPVLTPAEVAELAELGLRAQRLYGHPVDIEWAQVAGQLALLQCRPITTLRCAALPGERTTADFKDGGVSSTVCAPFMWSLYDFVWEVTMPTYLDEVHLRPAGGPEVRWGDMFFGRPYWNVGEVKAALSRLPGYVERSFDEDLGIAVPYEGQGKVTRTTPRSLVAGLKVLWALLLRFRTWRRACERFAAEQRRRLAELEQVDLALLPREELFSFYRRLIKVEYFRSESTYFYHIYDNSNAASLFKAALGKLGVQVELPRLLSGLKNLSHLAPNEALWKLSRAIRAAPEARDFWERTEVAELAAGLRAGATDHHLDGVRAFIAQHGHHSARELDLLVPRYREDPTFVLESLKDYVALPESPQGRSHEERSAEAYEEERARLLRQVPRWRRRGLAGKLDEWRGMLWWREELRDLSTRCYAQVRRFTVEVARRLVEQGRLGAVEDVFFLPVEDVLAACEGQRTSAELQDLVARNRAYYESFRCFANPNELGSRFTAAGSPGAAPVGASALRGVACSAGVVTGTARVIRDIYDAHRLRQGDVLVTRYTDPGWTPRFELLAGVTTEAGGLLSHAAVISREYGIPAVLAVPGLTERVRDGQTITLDGGRGLIILHEE